MGEIRNNAYERRRQERLQRRRDNLIKTIERETNDLESLNVSELQFLKKVLKNLDDYRTLDKFLSHK